MQFASVPLTGFAQGFVPIVSYNYGHGDKQRVKDCFRVALITMFSFNLLLMLFMILFPSTVASAFTSDERLIETVRWTMPVFLGGMTIFGLQRACQNMFVALGQAKISIFIALLRKAILLIPLALILPHFMGVAGVYAAEAISDATAAIVLHCKSVPCLTNTYLRIISLSPAIQPIRKPGQNIFEKLPVHKIFPASSKDFIEAKVLPQTLTRHTDYPQ